jgi:homospermidine synthase
MNLNREICHREQKAKLHFICKFRNIRNQILIVGYKKLGKAILHNGFYFTYKKNRISLVSINFCSKMTEYMQNNCAKYLQIKILSSNLF